MSNVDQAEIGKFTELAHSWWDPAGPFKPLHAINPVRLEFIQRFVTLSGAQALDVGCGGGILAESLVRQGASVTGIDLAAKPLSIARMHALDQELVIDYREIAVEDLAQAQPAQFDVVTCMEMLEHVPDPASVIAACARLVKPGGHVFFATLNRTPKAWLMAVLGAEYLLRWLPRGTHDYARFRKPSEIAAMARPVGLELQAVAGIEYQLFSQQFVLSDDPSVNYLMAWQKRVDA